MSDNKDFELGQQIAELRGLVIQGFKGVHQRQDTTNGRLLKAEDDIKKLKNKGSYNDGREKGVSMSWGFLITILGAVITVTTIIAKIPFK